MVSAISFIAAAAFAACSDVDLALTVQADGEGTAPAVETGKKHGMTVLGDRIPNAYTPEVTKFYNPSYLYIYYDNVYTPIVRDLIDDSGNSKTCPSNNSYTEDVSGVAMSDIEHSLKSASSWNSWRDNLIKLYPNKKEGINHVFSVWAE